MWNLFTKRMTQVVFFADAEARRLGTTEVGPEHLLLGLTREKDHVAARVLKHFHVSRRRVRSEIERQVVPGGEISGQEMRLSPSGQRVLDLSYEEACQVNRGDNIGTEHLLLGLLREEEGAANRVLVRLRGDLERVRTVGAQIANTVQEGRFGRPH